MRRMFVGSAMALSLILIAMSGIKAGDMGSDLLAGCHPQSKCQRLNVSVASSVDETGVVSESVSFSTTRGFVEITTPSTWVCTYTDKSRARHTGWGLKMKQAIKGHCERFSGVEQLP